jgi:hypothetical protein
MVSASGTIQNSTRTRGQIAIGKLKIGPGPIRAWASERGKSTGFAGDRITPRHRRRSAITPLRYRLHSIAILNRAPETIATLLAEQATPTQGLGSNHSSTLAEHCARLGRCIGAATQGCPAHPIPCRCRRCRPNPSSILRIRGAGHTRLRRARRQRQREIFRDGSCVGYRTKGYTWCVKRALHKGGQGGRYVCAPGDLLFLCLAAFVTGVVIAVASLLS